MFHFIKIKKVVFNRNKKDEFGEYNFKRVLIGIQPQLATHSIHPSCGKALLTLNGGQFCKNSYKPTIFLSSPLRAHYSPPEETKSQTSLFTTITIADTVLAVLCLFRYQR